jgi:hypothetical protein
VNRRIWITGLLLVFIFVACEKMPFPAQGKPEPPPVPKVIVEKEKVERTLPPPEVKIRLKKDGKDSYSWELSGSDVDQILKVNEKLRKQLGRDPSK